MHIKDQAGLSTEELLDLYWYALDESIALLMLNEQGRVTYANKQFATLSGYSVSEVHGRFTDFIDSSSHHQGFKTELENLIQSGKIWKRDFCLQAKDGKAMKLHAAFYPWPGRQQPRQHLIVLQPVTEQQQAWPGDPVSRKEELSHIAHDLRNPLYNLSALCGLLFDTPLNEQQLDFVKKMKRTTGILSGMIDDMVLTCMGAEAGIRPAIKALSLKKTIEDFQLLFARRAQEKGIQTAVETDLSLPDCVYGDSRRLSQIIIYLSEFLIGHPATRSIRITALSEEKNKNNYEISFFVLGQFAPSEPQNDDAILNVTDFNLTLEKVKYNIDLLQGSILLQEMNPQAFYFHFLLPFDMNPPKEAGQEDQAATTPLVFTPKPQNIKILVAEDVELNQMVMKHQLNKMGIDAEFVRTGFNVLEKLKTNEYDLILMDVQMPGLNGLQTMEAIRAAVDAPYSDIPIIGITASIGQNARKKCLEAGANDFVPKPYEPEELKNKIENLVTQYRQEGKINLTSNLPQKNIMTEKLYNLSNLEELSDGDQEFMISMISYFVDNTPEVLENLNSKTQTQDWEAVRNIAHKMKPQLNYVGINQIEEEVEQIEQNALKKENLDNIPAMVENTTRICRQAIEQLKSELEKLTRD
ncbi:MAG: response regulator [Bacteroidales bacterium]|nr:response regulator [Bacteroidales bacterium]